MINDSLNQTIQATGKLTFENVTALTNNTIFVMCLIIIIAFPLIIWLIMGALVKARSTDGRILSKSMWHSSNYWLAYLIFVIQGLLILFLLIIPIWLKF